MFDLSYSEWLVVFSVLAPIFAGFVAIYQAVFKVPQGFVYIVEKSNQFSRILQPGFNIINPIHEKVVAKVYTNETKYSFTEITISESNPSILASGIVSYKVIDAGKAFYNSENLEESIIDAVITNLKVIVPALDNNFSDISKLLFPLLKESILSLGLRLIDVEIKLN